MSTAWGLHIAGRLQSGHWRSRLQHANADRVVWVHDSHVPGRRLQGRLPVPEGRLEDARVPRYDPKSRRDLLPGRPRCYGHCFTDDAAPRIELSSAMHRFATLELARSLACRYSQYNPKSSWHACFPSATCEANDASASVRGKRVHDVLGDTVSPYALQRSWGKLPRNALVAVGSGRHTHPEAQYPPYIRRVTRLAFSRRGQRHVGTPLRRQPTRIDTARCEAISMQNRTKQRDAKDTRHVRSSRCCSNSNPRRPLAEDGSISDTGRTGMPLLSSFLAKRGSPIPR
jgi:hypothetical protein